MKKNKESLDNVETKELIYQDLDSLKKSLENINDTKGLELVYSSMGLFKEYVEYIKDSEVSKLERNVINESNKILENPEASETTKLPEYTFNGKKVVALEGEYNQEKAMEEAGKRGLTIPNKEKLQALRKDYTEKFPDWKEDVGEKTFKNPLGFQIGGYWSSTPYAGNRNGAWIVRFGGGRVRNVGKYGSFYVVCLQG